jgi:hypothetical protein
VIVCFVKALCRLKLIHAVGIVRAYVLNARGKRQSVKGHTLKPATVAARALLALKQSNAFVHSSVDTQVIKKYLRPNTKRSEQPIQSPILLTIPVIFVKWSLLNLIA